MAIYPFNFEKLIAYQRSKEYVSLVYGLIEGFPKEERYALCDQLRRAAISVTSNIAEGMSRSTIKDKVHFLNIAYGSLMETFSQMDIAHDRDYINDQDFEMFREAVCEILKLLAGLKRSLLQKAKEAEKLKTESNNLKTDNNELKTEN